MAIVWMDSFYYPSEGVPGAYQFPTLGRHETSATEGRDGRSCLKLDYISSGTGLFTSRLEYRLPSILTTTYIGIAIKITAAPLNANYQPLISFVNGQIQAALHLNNTLIWTLARNNAGQYNATLVTSSVPCELNKWFYIEIKYTPQTSATVNATKLIVNGVEASVPIGTNTQGIAVPTTTIANIRLEAMFGIPGITRYSDFYIDDAMNRGDVIVQGHPFANIGYLNDFASTGDKVAAINSFDTASYLSSSVDAEQYFIPNPAAFPDNIDAYKFHVMVNKSSPGKRYFNHGTYSPQVNYPTLTPYEGAWQIYPMIQIPATPLTKAQLAAQQFGLRATS